MKSTLLTLMIAAYLIVGWLRPEAPRAIQIVGLSESEIKEQVKSEQKEQWREKRYRQAERQAARVYARVGCVVPASYATLTGRAATDFGVSPQLLAALVFVESSCKPNANDGLGSIGLTQVNTKTWKRSKHELLDPETNLRVGASVLARYVKQYGVEEGLHHYNGYSEVHTHVYVQKVLEASRG
jgi:soluble lytic murein transglycosylase-like protein